MIIAGDIFKMTLERCHDDFTVISIQDDFCQYF